ncbi:hypothetical protein ABZ622_34735 [Streptomyces sp. NPDC007164]|uniref:hypothetical protein n=1 Tax=Streptomyces sp. NPDC007164 TaxID=3156918 RepID=UPI0033FBFD97
MALSLVDQMLHCGRRQATACGVAGDGDGVRPLLGDHLGGDRYRRRGGNGRGQWAIGTMTVAPVRRTRSTHQ